jgi:hypothetical protein
VLPPVAHLRSSVSFSSVGHCWEGANSGRGDARTAVALWERTAPAPSGGHCRCSAGAAVLCRKRERSLRRRTLPPLPPSKAGQPRGSKTRPLRRSKSRRLRGGQKQTAPGEQKQNRYEGAKPEGSDGAKADGSEGAKAAGSDGAKADGSLGAKADGPRGSRSRSL